MKEHIIKTYSFDELSEESKEKAIDEFRYNNDNFEIYSGDVSETLKAFMKIFGAEFKRGNNYNWSIDPIDSKVNWNFEDDVLALSGLRLQKYLYNNYWKYITKGKYYSTKSFYDENKKYHYRYRYSRITREWDNCPLTGACYDYDVLFPLINFINARKPDNRDIEQILNECTYELLKALKQELDYLETDEGIIERIEANNYEFLETGKLY